MNAAGRFLRVFSCALALLVVPATSHAAGPDRDPKPHSDPVDATGSPLDVRSYALGQRGTELVLSITTAGSWETSQLSQAEGRSICIQLFYGTLPTPRSQFCVVNAGDDEPGLLYTRLDPFGGTVATERVEGSYGRSNKRSVQAVFDPSSVNLGQGRYSWQLQTRWSCGEGAPCSDFAPDGGNVIAQVRPLSEPSCFGAASRNPRFLCRNPSLKLAVVPTPDEALLSPNATCDNISLKLPYTCEFGVRPAIANRTIALVGDSHATHWRGALEVVAQARRWHGYSITRSGCPLSTAPPDLPKARRDSCGRWRQAVFSWFKSHPEVQTVFVSELAGLGVHAPRGTRSKREYEINGFLKAWRRLPGTVRQVIVLRDTPTTSDSGSECVARAIRQRKPAGPACAISRSRALRSDPAAVAARRPNTKRVHVIDLTRYMCSRRQCYPVVGGVLVHKDNTHITNLFAGTLGPFVLHAVHGLLG